MSYGKSRVLPTIAQLPVPVKTVIPPNSAIHVNGKLTETIEGSYIIEPQEDIPVMMQRCVYSEMTSPRLC